MFGDLMGNLEKQQAEMIKKLSSKVIEVSQEGVTVTGDASKKIHNIGISKEILETGDVEMLEDLLVATFNKFIVEAQQAEAAETQGMMGDLLPPGFENLFK